jgi:alpha-glucosidase
VNLLQSELPHHDGSEKYVSDSSPQIGGEVSFKVRVGRVKYFDRVILRIYEDGEPRFYPMKISGDPSEAHVEFWKISLPIINKKTSYRFLLTKDDRYFWLNARGFFSFDVTSAEDFHILTGAAYPTWIRGSVFYQIFPDRFATTGKYLEKAPDHFVPRKWSDLPKGKDPTTGVEFFGGDLDGVSERLEYLKELGINGIYFTPLFPANSTHRYDASSFDEIDPLLGGDEALARLITAAKVAKIAIMGDLTTNHCGAKHNWLAKALKDKSTIERGFFYWDESIPHGYEGWWGLASLPKLNFNSAKLREIFFSGDGSIVKKWLRPPYEMSGWRIDVGNMTGRYKGEDLNSEVILGVRSALDEVDPEKWLVAENADHFPKDLDGFGWHGTMNYNGFMRPIWGWLENSSDTQYGFFGLPVSIPKFDGSEMVSAMRMFASGIPWCNFVSSMVLLDSHDTARFRNVVGHDSSRHIVGMGLLLTYPGVPSIFAGDEVGLTGAWGEDARRTIDWSRSDWDLEFLAEVKKLIEIRRSSRALANGGIRWLHISSESISFARESLDEDLIVIATRSACDLELSELKKCVRLYGPEIVNSRFLASGPAIGIYRRS